jgi:hypothetical protein
MPALTRSTNLTVVDGSIDGRALIVLLDWALIVLLPHSLARPTHNLARVIIHVIVALVRRWTTGSRALEISRMSRRTTRWLSRLNKIYRTRWRTTNLYEILVAETVVLSAGGTKNGLRGHAASLRREILSSMRRMMRTHPSSLARTPRKQRRRRHRRLTARMMRSWTHITRRMMGSGTSIQHARIETGVLRLRRTTKRVHVARSLAIRHGRTRALRWTRVVAADSHGIGAGVAAAGRAERWGTGVGDAYCDVVGGVGGYGCVLRW